MCDVANHVPLLCLKKKDAPRRLNFSTKQKLTCAIRVLTYRLSADLFDKFLNIGESIALEILQHFTRAIWNVYHEEFLRRPTKSDLPQLLDKAIAKLGISGNGGEPRLYALAMEKLPCRMAQTVYRI